MASADEHGIMYTRRTYMMMHVWHGILPLNRMGALRALVVDPSMYRHVAAATLMQSLIEIAMREMIRPSSKSDRHFRL